MSGQSDHDDCDPWGQVRPVEARGGQWPWRGWTRGWRTRCPPGGAGVCLTSPSSTRTRYRPGTPDWRTGASMTAEWWRTSGQCPATAAEAGPRGFHYSAPSGAWGTLAALQSAGGRSLVSPQTIRYIMYRDSWKVKIFPADMIQFGVLSHPLSHETEQKCSALNRQFFAVQLIWPIYFLGALTRGCGLFLCIMIPSDHTSRCIPWIIWNKMSQGESLEQSNKQWRLKDGIASSNFAVACKSIISLDYLSFYALCPLHDYFVWTLSSPGVTPPPEPLPAPSRGWGEGGVSDHCTGRTQRRGPD